MLKCSTFKNVTLMIQINGIHLKHFHFSISILMVIKIKYTIGIRFSCGFQICLHFVYKWNTCLDVNGCVLSVN